MSQIFLLVDIFAKIYFAAIILKSVPDYFIFEIVSKIICFETVVEFEIFRNGSDILTVEIVRENLFCLENFEKCALLFQF